MEADFDSNTAFEIDDQNAIPPITTTQNFGYDHVANPRVWFGWQDDWGLAYRVTYFEFDDARNTSATSQADFVFFNGLPTSTALPGGRLLVGGSAGDTIVAESALEYYTIDAEITQELNFDRWQTTFGGGFRHAAFSQRYQAVGTAAAAVKSADYRHRFDGEGPTLFGELRIPFLGAKDRRCPGSASLSLFGNARGSIIFGHAKLAQVDVDPTNPGPMVFTADLNDKDNLTVGEVKLGAQFDMRPADGGLIFVAVAWEAQWLNGAGSLSSLSDNNDMALTGFSVTGGLDW
jgi:hypothetical protein